MRSRPLWQLIAAVLIFKIVQVYLLTFQSPFDVNGLAWVQSYIWLLIALPMVVYFRDKAGKLGFAFAHSISTDEEQSLLKQHTQWIVLGWGLAFLILMLALLERHQPFFFTQDDNLAQFLPVILQGCRSLLHGVFPTWNPYQFLGAPTTSVGVYSLTYPFTYLAYFVSRFLLRNEFLTLEVYCIFHLVAGYFSMYWAARCYRVRPHIASMAALCAVLSGWALIASRSWFYVSPIFLYMPLLVVGIRKLELGQSTWKWIVGMALVIGLFFHAGNVQFWTYGLMFLWIALLTLWWAGKIHRKEIFASISASLIGIGLACPLFVPQFLQTRNIFRVMNGSLGAVSEEWWAFLLPGPWVHAYVPTDWVDPDWKTGGLIVYSGSTFVLLCALVLVAFIFYRFPRKTIASNVWIVCGTVAFLALMGKTGVLWLLMLRTPLLDKFRLAFKFLAFFNIFAAIAGAIVCERLLRRARALRNLELAIVAPTAILLAASCMMYLPSWYSYGMKPYPNADRLLENIYGRQSVPPRIVSLALLRSRSSRFWEGMPSNFPTVYQVPALLGYDPLVEFTPRFAKVRKAIDTQFLRSLQEYGVEYAFLPNDFEHPRTGGYREAWGLEIATPVRRTQVTQLPEFSQVVFRDEEISVLQVPGTKPLAFPELSPATALPIHLAGNGLDIETTDVPNGGSVVANFFWYPEMHAKADGAPLPITPDSWQRMKMDVPKGTKSLRLRFTPPWWKGFGLGALACGLGFVAGFLGLRNKRPVSLPDRHRVAVLAQQ